MTVDPLKQIVLDTISEHDVQFEDARERDVTEKFIDWIFMKVRLRMIVLLAIRGMMRSSKSTSGFWICHLIRLAQKKYIDKTLPNLTPEMIVRKNQSEFLDFIKQGHRDTISQCDEDMALTGIGSNVEELTINNMLEIIAKYKNHVVFLNPKEFMFPNACEYGLMFYDRDDENKTSRYMLYDLANCTHKDIYTPIGLVTIPKIVDNEWKKKNWEVYDIVDDKMTAIGQKFDSYFEYKYETGIKEEIIKNQMSLESANVRINRLFKRIDELKVNDKFKEMVLKKKGMDRKRFIRGFVPQFLGGAYNSEEVQKFTDYVEGLGEDLFD